MLVGEEEVKRRWVEYYEELLNRDEPEDPVDEYPPNLDVMMEPSADMILAAIRSLKNNKAAGTDDIWGELLKYGNDGLKSKLIEIIKRIWNEEEMPEEWQTAIYIPLHKKGDRSRCSNYRGLSILNIGYKMLKISFKCSV